MKIQCAAPIGARNPLGGVRIVRFDRSQHVAAEDYHFFVPAWHADRAGLLIADLFLERLEQVEKKIVVSGLEDRELEFAGVIRTALRSERSSATSTSCSTARNWT